jgi:hypothetical protein
MTGNVNPIWLDAHWKKKRMLTVERINNAVEELHKTGAAITIGRICETVKRVYGISISANTITRNSLAYDIYVAHRVPPRARMLKEPALSKLLREAPDPEKQSLRARITRLRRMPKDGLISGLIRLEDASCEQKMLECRLREEIVRLTLASSAGGGK